MDHPGLGKKQSDPAYVNEVIRHFVDKQPGAAPAVPAQLLQIFLPIGGEIARRQRGDGVGVGQTVAAIPGTARGHGAQVG